VKQILSAGKLEAALPLKLPIQEEDEKQTQIALLNRKAGGPSNSRSLTKNSEVFVLPLSLILWFSRKWAPGREWLQKPL